MVTLRVNWREVAMCLLQRFYNAVVKNRERTEAKLKDFLTETMPYYDMDNMSDYSMEELVKKILEITDGEK